jgi:adenine/guanine phosphoribosyltransferase-like PRPP-binding protein
MDYLISQEKIDGAREGKRKWEERLLSGLSDSTTFDKIVEALAEPFACSQVHKVACFEALGFPLGASVAHVLKAGLVLVRKTKHDEKPDNISLDFETETFCDYDSKQKTFKVLKSAVPIGTRILIVDDLCEKGEQLRAATTLFTRLDATVIGAVFISCVRSQVDNVGYNFPIHNLDNEKVANLLPCQNKGVSIK